MNKEFVPYAQSLRLKALGFDEPCFGWYEHNGNFYYCYQEGLVPPSPSKKLIKGCCLCPTFSQAFRFFRDNYKLHHNIVYLKFKKQYLAETEGTAIYFDETEYDEAELDCLEKLIIIVENNKEK